MEEMVKIHIDDLIEFMRNRIQIEMLKSKCLEERNVKDKYIEYDDVCFILGIKKEGQS